MFTKADCFLTKLTAFIIYIMKMCYTNVSNFGRMISFSIIIIISQNEYFSFYIERSND